MTNGLSLHSFQAAALRVCFDEEPSPDDIAQLDGPEDRWMVYREMVRNRLAKMIRAGLPRFVKSCSEEEMTSLIRSFFADARVQSHYIRDCVPEFASFVREFRGDALRADAAAHLMWDEAVWCVRHMPAPTIKAVEFQFEAAPVVNPARLDLELPVDPEADGGGKAFITVFRQQDTNRMRDMRMTAFARRLWDSLVQTETPIMNSIESLAAAESVEVDHAFIQRVCDILAEFLDHGLLLGSHLASSHPAK